MKLPITIDDLIPFAKLGNAVRDYSVNGKPFKLNLAYNSEGNFYSIQILLEDKSTHRWLVAASMEGYKTPETLNLQWYSFINNPGLYVPELR